MIPATALLKKHLTKYCSTMYRFSITSESNSHPTASTTTTISYPPYASYNNNNNKQVEDFFYDDPSLSYKSLPERTIQESPCYHIIGKNKNLDFCNLH